MRTGSVAAAIVLVLLVARVASASDSVERPQAAAELEPMVRVRVAADRPVTLEGLRAWDAGWQTVCASPCDGRIPRDASYRVTGPDLAPSTTFRLAWDSAPDERLVLKVRAVDASARTNRLSLIVGGGVSAGLGVVGLVTSAFWALGNAVESQAGCDNGGCGSSFTSNPPPTWLPVTSLVLVVAGAVLLPVGLTTPSGPSNVTVIPAGETSLGEARQPSWREPPSEASAAPHAMSIPLASLAF